MNSSYICNSCRLKLGLAGLGPQSHAVMRYARRETFASFANTHKYNLNDDVSQQELLDIMETPKSAREPGSLKPVARYVRSPKRSYIATHKDSISQKDLLGQFFPGLGDVQAGETAKVSTSPIKASPEQILYMCQQITKLKTNTQTLGHKGLSATWDVFVETLGPRVWKQKKIQPEFEAFQLASSTLMQKLLRNYGKYDRPSISDLAQEYAAGGMLSYKTTLRMLQLVLQDLDALQKTCGQITVEPNTSHWLSGDADTQEEELIRNLLGVWRTLIISPPLPEQLEGFDAATNWKGWDPKFPVWAGENTNAGPSLFGAVVTPGYTEPALSLLFGKAMHSLAILLDSKVLLQGLPLRDHIFVKTMTKVMRLSGMDTDDCVRILLKDTHTRAIQPELVVSPEFWRKVLRLDVGTAMDVKPPQFQASSSSRILPAPNQTSVDLRKRLNKAWGMEDRNAVSGLWIEARNTVVTAKSTSDKPDLGVLDHELCDLFIKVFMALRLPRKAIVVWNELLVLGLKPTLSTWNVLLDGLRACRDSKAMEETWTRMLAGGVQPDNALWTTRISGLVDSSKPEAALKVLHEMGTAWELEVKRSKKTVEQLYGIKQLNGVVRPTVEVINAAISGLLKRNHNESANRVVKWGIRFDIKPDIFMYNTLLAALMRDSKVDKIGTVLKDMQANGLQPDHVTFTTILEGAFQDAASMTVQQQIDTVNEILNEMQSLRIKANMRTYGRLISTLLHNATDDVSAVQAVLARMKSEGMTPSTRIYTMLVMHHFSSSPPNLVAIHSLIEHVSTSGQPADYVFWDRIIEGYAKMGDTRSAMAILAREDKGTVHAGWWTMGVLLQALATNREWDLARNLVLNVRSARGGPLSKNVKGVDGQHGFWDLVGELGNKLK